MIWRMLGQRSGRVVALDVGGSSIKSGIVAPGGKLAGLVAMTPVDSSADADLILDTLAGIIRRHLGEPEAAACRGIAFGFPSPFDYRTGTCFVRQLGKYDSLYGLNIADEMRTRLGETLPPIVFRNDAEAAIVGEARFGAGRPYRRLIGITLGTGLGSAFIVNGRPAGIPEPEWLYRQPFAGVRADDWFSRRGLEGRLAELGVAPDVKAAAESARAGDYLLRKLWADFGSELAAFLRPHAKVFEAQAIIVLGRIAGAFDLFGVTLTKGLSIPVLRGERPDDAALLGAADLVFDPER